MQAEHIEKAFADIVPAGAEFCSLRYCGEASETISVRQDVLEPLGRSRTAGAMLTVAAGGGLGYAATADLTRTGLRRAARAALAWARRTAGRSVVDFSRIAWSEARGEWHGREEIPWDGTSPAEKAATLAGLARRLRVGPRIVDWSATVWHADTETLYLTTRGARVYQRVHVVFPRLSATAAAGTRSQTRTSGGLGTCRQGGLEVLAKAGLDGRVETIGEEADALLDAANCPTDTLDVVLDPDQMVLQIHESIGHPLELDRILGDERNYAGTSFVTPDMLGTYRYGSPLLNVVFDPTPPDEIASYGFDDEGLPARREYIIRDGVLLRALGATVSSARAGLPPLANARAHGWNRPPMDRMANLNLEPGRDTLDALIGGVARGVYMKTNCSWSIDDSRNKFQFGCEWARLIEDGRLTSLVRNPSYRGISATFWRSLDGVGGPETVGVMGSPNCGKGEPNQLARVGHASPVCRFRNVQVFGGA